MQKQQALGPLGPGEKMMEVLKGGGGEEERSHEKNYLWKTNRLSYCYMLHTLFPDVPECGCRTSILAALATPSESPTEAAALPANIRQ